MNPRLDDIFESVGGTDSDDSGRNRQTDRRSPPRYTQKIRQTRLTWTEHLHFLVDPKSQESWGRRGSNTGPLDLQSNVFPTAPQTLRNTLRMCVFIFNRIQKGEGQGKEMSHSN